MMKKNLYLIKNGKIIRKQNTLYFVSKKESSGPPAQPGKPADGAPGYLADEDDERTDLEDDISDKPEFEKRPLAVEQVDAILCYGRISLTSGVISFLSKYSIPVHFFGYYGHYESTLLPKEALLSGEMHVRQASHYLDHAKRLALARSFVTGSAANIKRNLEYYQNQEKPLAGVLKDIDVFLDSVETCKDIGQLLALEGNIRSNYYSTFDMILKPGFPFGGRSRNPPSNPLNAMISFGNSLVYGQAINAIYRTQLDQTISFLHVPSERRFSLALDIAEIFKPLLVDRVIFKLVNKDMISPHDFTTELGSCLLNDKGRRLFLTEFNEKMETTIKHRDLGRNVSYGRLIYLECIKIGKHVMGIKDYKPFTIWW
ncbi:MAG: type I-B CRISPR-associated endonuclease Cas1b [Methanoregula sp.]|nr:type I-B CRISPR-associated endonuclease Cas1b [Methanoregula sp.]